MSRLHFTTSEEMHARASHVCDLAQLRACTETVGDGLYLRSYEKRVFESNNFLSLGPDEWICVCGTLFVDGKLGGDALPGLWDLFTWGGIQAARQGSFGHYAAVVRQHDKVRAFTDEHAAMRLYYASDANGQPFMSNSLHVIADALGAPQVDPFGLLFYTWFGENLEDTYYSGVKKLFGSQLLEIDVTSGRMTIHDVPVTMDRLDPADEQDVATAVDAYVKRVRTVFEQVAAQPSVGVYLSGGKDSRTNLAACLSAGAKPLLMSGVSNSLASDYRGGRDLEIAREISDYLGLPFYVADWSGTQPQSKAVLSWMFRRYGHLYSAWGGSEGLFAEYEGGVYPYPKLQLGGFSPAFNQSRPWGDVKSEYGLDDLADAMCGLCGIPDLDVLTPTARNEMIERHRRAAAAVCQHTGISFPDRGATAEQFITALLNSQMVGESHWPYFANEFTYYLAPFCTGRLYDPLVTVPLEYRQGDGFQVRLIEALAPELTRFAVYSSAVPLEIDLESHTLRSPTAKPHEPNDAVAPQTAETTPERVTPLQSHGPTPRGLVRRSVARILPLTVKQSLLRLLYPPTEPAVPSVEPESATLVAPEPASNEPPRPAIDIDERMRDAVRIELQANPLMRDVFEDADLRSLYFPRVYGLYLRLFAIDQTRKMAASATEPADQVDSRQSIRHS